MVTTLNYRLPCYERAYERAFNAIHDQLMRDHSPIFGFSVPKTDANFDQLKEPHKSANEVVNPSGELLRPTRVEVNVHFPCTVDEVRKGNFDQLFECLNASVQEHLLILLPRLLQSATDQGALQKCQIDMGDDAQNIWDQMIDQYENFDIQFNSDGTEDSSQVMVVSPELMRRLESAPPQTEEQLRRYQEIRNRKWQNWNARQRSRRLH